MKTRILDAAEQEFSRTGFHNTNVSSIAERAGVGKGSVYRYFDDKLDLFTNTVTRGYQQFRQKVCEVLHQAGSAPEKLEQIQQTYIEFFEDSRELVEIILGEGLPSEKSFYREISHERELFFRELRSWFQNGIDEGIFREDLSAAELAEFFHEFTTTELRRVVLDRRELDRGRFNLIREIFLEGTLRLEREVDTR